MYLMMLDTTAYVVITLLFAIIFGIAYKVRRQNNTVAQFFSADVLTISSMGAFGSFGIIEVVGIAMLSALYGINFTYYMLIVGFLVWLLFNRRQTAVNPGVLIGSTEVYYKDSGYLIRILALWRLCGYIFLVGLSLVVAFKLLQSLFGWTFISSVFGIVLLAVISALVGGTRGSVYIRLILAVITIAIIIGILAIALIGLGGMEGIFNNLQILAIGDNLSPDFYMQLHLNWLWFCRGVVLLIVYLGLDFLSPNFLNKRTPKFITSLGVFRLITILVVSLIGVIAIATPLSKPFGKNSQVITYEAQLPNGEIGYVVQAVPSQFKGGNKAINASPTKGLLPPLLNPATDKVNIRQHDYLQAFSLSLRYYLPPPIKFMAAVVIIMLLSYSLIGYFIGGSFALTYGFLAKGKFYQTHADVGLIWAARVSIVGIAFTGLAVAHFMLNSFDLINYLIAFAVIFAVPLLIVNAYVSNYKT